MNTAEADGLTWINRDDYDDWLGFHPIEPYVLPILQQIKGDTFVDCGAHVGRYSVRLAPNFRKVHAIEPNPITREGLELNLAGNGIDNVETHDVAAWDRDAKVEFIFDRGITRAESGTNHWIEARSLDTLIPPEDHVDLFKIDVEGAEAHVLIGAMGILRIDRPAVMIEMHDRVYAFKPPNHLVDSVAAVLASVDYGWEDVGTYEQSHHWFAQPKERDAAAA